MRARSNSDSPGPCSASARAKCSSSPVTSAWQRADSARQSGFPVYGAHRSKVATRSAANPGSPARTAASTASGVAAIRTIR